MGPGDVNDGMPGFDGLRILEFEKKTVSWDLGLDEARRFSELAETRPVVCGGGRTWWGRWKSQHRKKLCLSLLMSKKLKIKKVIKSFVHEQISCFSDSYMRMNIMNVLCMWISRSYFWTWICYISIEDTFRNEHWLVLGIWLTTCYAAPHNHTVWCTVCCDTFLFYLD